MDESSRSLRSLYQLTELPGDNLLKSAQGELDAAVRLAYGMSPKDDALSFLLSLNLKVASLESKGTPIQAPGIPSGFNDLAQLVSEDRVTVRALVTN